MLIFIFSRILIVCFWWTDLCVQNLHVVYSEDWTFTLGLYIFLLYFCYISVIFLLYFYYDIVLFIIIFCSVNLEPGLDSLGYWVSHLELVVGREDTGTKLIRGWARLRELGQAKSRQYYNYYWNYMIYIIMFEWSL